LPLFTALNSSERIFDLITAVRPAAASGRRRLSQVPCSGGDIDEGMQSFLNKTVFALMLMLGSKFLANPVGFVHGTKMFVNLPSETDRQNVIAYLETLKK
jgi:hypothetical protein